MIDARWLCVKCIRPSLAGRWAASMHNEYDPCADADRGPARRTTLVTRGVYG